MGLRIFVISLLIQIGRIRVVLRLNTADVLPRLFTPRIRNRIGSRWSMLVHRRIFDRERLVTVSSGVWDTVVLILVRVIIGKRRRRMELLLRALTANRLRLVRILRRVLRRSGRRGRKVVGRRLLTSRKVLDLIVTTEDTPVIASLLWIRIVETLSTVHQVCANTSRW